ncbi:predicted protein [Plenodomus lingam JN3]|uniref:Predicted protein n=1 Tax=Leptosphaeria maculans (strain JN3 / isolate v23.1.3 / race Av1-4-5-6-7-8) TaxID=985895 RepID=E5R4P5_LEPMJ|nr:predicted protein [Plenodomus lingam JN3]CBX92168.1 predicted protein [Plenodomus lingam JN3]
MEYTVLSCIAWGLVAHPMEAAEKFVSTEGLNPFGSPDVAGGGYGEAVALLGE